MNLGMILKALERGYGGYESARDANVWSGLETALKRRAEADSDLDSVLGREPRPALTHQQAFGAGMTAAVAALLGADSETLQRSLSGYLGESRRLQSDAESRELGRLTRRAASAADLADLELARSRALAERLESSRRRTAALVLERQRSADNAQESALDRESRLTQTRIRAEAKRKSDTDRLAAAAEATKIRSQEAQLHELADLFLGVLAAKSRAPYSLGLSDEAEGMLRELLDRLGVRHEVRPLKVLPVSGPIGRQ